MPYSRVIDGKPKPIYWVQMQVQLEVACLDICDFLECTFKEYKSREEYLSDIVESPDTESPDSASSDSESDNEEADEENRVVEWETSTKKLKGVIGVMKYGVDQNVTYKYVYPKLGQNLVDAEEEAKKLALEEGYEDEITLIIGG